MHCPFCLRVAGGHKVVDGRCEVCGVTSEVNTYQVCEAHAELMSAHTSIFDAVKTLKKSGVKPGGPV